MLCYNYSVIDRKEVYTGKGEQMPQQPYSIDGKSTEPTSVHAGAVESQWHNGIMHRMVLDSG